MPSDLLAGYVSQFAGEDCPVANPFPAKVLRGEAISDHTPVQLLPPSERPARRRRGCRLPFDKVTDEERGELNEDLVRRLEPAGAALNRHCNVGKISHFFAGCESIVWGLMPAT